VIMTSNLGSQYITDYAGSGDSSDGGDYEHERMRDTIMEVLKQSFRPEFLNRIDEILIFNRLGKDEISRIVQIQLGLVRARLADKGFSIVWTPAVRDYLARAGYDPIYGARPLKRAIQKELENTLALEILQGRFREGDAIQVGVAEDGESLEFQ